MPNVWIFILGALILATVFVTWVNGRHERRKAAEGPSPDERVEAAWEDFGPAEDPESVRATVDEVLEHVTPATLGRKASVISLAIMATRAERYDVLPALAERSRSLDGGCGETAALAVLAEACTGDIQRARRMFIESQSAMAGCASCGAKGPGRYLMQELALLLDAMGDEGAGVRAPRETA
jgi:hypothetical protein